MTGIKCKDKKMTPRRAQEVKKEKKGKWKYVKASMNAQQVVQ